MSGYALHPESVHRHRQNPRAHSRRQSGRRRPGSNGNFRQHPRSGSFSPSGLSPPEYYIPPPTVQADALICDCLRARQEAVVGCGRVPRTPHPASDGRDLKRSRAIAPALPWAIMCAALKINPPAGCRFHTRCPWAIDECSRTKPQLQEIEPNHFASCIRINTNQPDIGAVAAQ